MKMSRVAWGLAFAAGLVASGSALADRGHGRVTFGINFGVPVGPWYYPPYYPPAFYPPYYPSYPPYLPTVVVSPSAPPVYVEKGGDAAAPEGLPSNYWYYCTNPQGYYPYVKECSVGWMTVLPQTPAQPGQAR